ncbi:low temperature requirement protein A [Streptomyces flaveolus]|uniref:low temperature requirement protein A n=1 Tax=Streptomyces flaveolus TaxID=67297 RepID=UPI0036FAA4D1
MTMCQLGWVGLLVLPPQARLPGITVMILAEVMVPVWAQSAGTAPWHPRHVAVRYELFTLIVLGESVAAATIAVRGAFDRHHGTVQLCAPARGGLLTAFACSPGAAACRAERAQLMPPGALFPAAGHAVQADRGRGPMMGGRQSTCERKEEPS